MKKTSVLEEKKVFDMTKNFTCYIELKDVIEDIMLLDDEMAGLKSVIHEYMDSILSDVKMDYDYKSDYTLGESTLWALAHNYFLMAISLDCEGAAFYNFVWKKGLKPFDVYGEFYSKEESIKAFEGFIRIIEDPWYPVWPTLLYQHNMPTKEQLIPVLQRMYEEGKLIKCKQKETMLGWRIF